MDSFLLGMVAVPRAICGDVHLQNFPRPNIAPIDPGGFVFWNAWLHHLLHDSWRLLAIP